MNSNFNDIIDVILTFNKNEELSKNIAVSGSIVPYIVTNKESLECHTDFYFLVKHKKINDVRDIIKKLSKEYTFDIVSDSKNYSASDYGFKIMYGDTVVGFFPYSIVDNNFTIILYICRTPQSEICIFTHFRMWLWYPIHDNICILFPLFM